MLKRANLVGFGLALAGCRPNGSSQKSSDFSDQENYGLNPIGFRAKRVKKGYKSNKSNYKFKIKILKQNVQIDQIKYI